GTVRLEIDTGRVIGRDALYEIQAGDVRQGKVFFLDTGKMGKEVKVVQGIPPETPLISIVAGDIRASLLLESLGLLGQRLPPGMLRKLDHVFFPSDSEASVKSAEGLRQDLRGAGLYDRYPDLMERLIERYATLDFVRGREVIYGFYAVYPGSLGESAPRSLIFRREKEKAETFWWNHAFLIEHLPPDAHLWAERSARLVKGAEEARLTDERQAVILEASGLSSVDHLIPVLAYLNRLAPRVVIWGRSRGAGRLASLKNPDLSFAGDRQELELILRRLAQERDVRHVTFLGSEKGASSVEPLVRELDLTFQAAPVSIAALLAGLGVPGELAAQLAAELAEETHLESQL
ncbi:MAG: hypothetical protein HYZ93_06285, partial [Candidatus Omnitrophica bacterium]|nr:hypothetical protein [Candidatus Omnitrophota bacterium]